MGKNRTADGAGTDEIGKRQNCDSIGKAAKAGCEALNRVELSMKPDQNRTRQ